ncbi:hypothetical protein [Clostridium sp. HBUAS56017]|nr:hypothetical protein [Clostridium sp. HBUAS56017]
MVLFTSNHFLVLERKEYKGMKKGVSFEEIISLTSMKYKSLEKVAK